MALIYLQDGKKAYADYNTAATIYQILEGAVVKHKDIKRLKKIAEKTIDIDFTKYKKGEKHGSSRMEIE